MRYASAFPSSALSILQLRRRRYSLLSSHEVSFTLGAIGAIADAALGRWGSILNFAAFVGLTLSGSLAVFGFATLAPERPPTGLTSPTA